MMFDYLGRVCTERSEIDPTLPLPDGAVVLGEFND